jgi:monoterpene epsilon-lactone hydrolase
MSSIRAKIIRAVTAAVMRRVDAQTTDINLLRRLEKVASKLAITAFGVRVLPDNIKGLYAEWLVPKDRIKGKLLLYLHGGGYIVGGCDMHRQMLSHIARAGKIQALLPEYRLAPEHKFPAAIDDCLTVYKSLLDNGVKSEGIIFAGDSAGGGLVMATLLALRDANDPLPAAAVLLSPFLDATGSGKSMQTRSDQDPIFDPKDLGRIAEFYCEPHQVRFPQVSPVFGNIEGLPPMYIQVGDDEILLSDSERIADDCVAAGIDVKLEVWPEMWHVFQIFTKKMPESKRAIQKIGDFIQSHIV